MVDISNLWDANFGIFNLRICIAEGHIGGNILQCYGFTLHVRRAGIEWIGQDFKWHAFFVVDDQDPVLTNVN